MNQLKISNNGIELIKSFEKFEPKAYLCPANKWTVGWGSTYKPDGTKVTSKDTITKVLAEEYLHHDCEDAEETINEYVKIKLNQNQFDALVCLVYNIGRKPFIDSTLLKRINSDDYIGIAIEYVKWVHGGGKILPGLITRRYKERDLFMKE